jgi:hypothetical protein
LLVPQYGYLASLTCFYRFWHMFIPVFFIQLYHVSLRMLKCICAHTLSCIVIYCSFASIGHADIMWSIVSSNFWRSLHLLSRCSIILSHCILFVTSGLVLSLFQYYYYYYYYSVLLLLLLQL